MTEPIVTIIVPGNPVPKGRPRFVLTGHVYSPERTRTYERELAILGSLEMGRTSPFEGPIKIDVEAAFEVPKSWSAKKTSAALTGVIHNISRLDIDNILKIVGDGLNQIVWKDDKQIVEARVIKKYGSTAYLKIQVWQVL